MDKVVENLKDEITEMCENCQNEFLVKYWDEELAWYIDVNLTKLCRSCQGAHSNESQTS